MAKSTKTKKPPVQLPQDEIDAEFENGSTMLEQATAADAFKPPIPAGRFANPHDYFDMALGEPRELCTMKHGHWNAGWDWAKSGKPARPSNGPAAPVLPAQDPSQANGSGIDDAMLAISTEIIAQNHIVKARKGEWTEAKEALTIAAKKLADEQNGLSRLVDALEEAKTGQLRLPFNKAEFLHGEHPDVAAGKERPLAGTPALDTVAKEMKKDGVAVLAMKDVTAIVGGNKKWISAGILKKLGAYPDKPLETVTQFRQFRAAVPLWPNTLKLTEKQCAELIAIMEEYDAIFPASAEPSAEPATDDPNVDENGLYISGYDEPPLKLAFRKGSQFHAHVMTILCADGKYRASWDSGANSDLTIHSQHSFTTAQTSAGFPTRTAAVLDAVKSVADAVPESSLKVARLADLTGVAEKIPAWGLDD